MHQTRHVNNELRAHIAHITHNASNRSIARAAGIEPTTLNRQLDGDVKVQTLVAICRAYRAPLLPAFLAAGYITTDEARAMGSISALAEATDRELVEEMLRRVVTAESEHPELTEPVSQDAIDNVTRGRFGTNVGGYAEDALHGIDTAAGKDETQADED